MADQKPKSGGTVAIGTLKLPQRADGKSLDDVLRERAAEKEGYTPQTIKANRGPTYQFSGRMLGEYSTNSDGRKSKWTEIRVWETPSGKWVIESIGCSDEPGHVDIVDATVIHGVEGGISMEFQAMEFWGWSSPAKALAKRLKWDLVVRVD